MGYVSLIVPTLIILPYVIFTVIYLSPEPEIRERAIFIFDEISTVLPAFAASLWGYFFTGGIFERAKDVFLIKNKHHLSRALFVGSVPLLLLIALCATTASIFASSYSEEITNVAFRTGVVALFCMLLIAVSLYLLKRSSVGLATSLFFTLFSYGAHAGWVFGLPAWMIPRGGHDGIGYVYFVGLLAALLLVTLVLCEGGLKRIINLYD